MVHRYKLNEPTCPVPLELLALMLRSDADRVGAVVEKLPPIQRAALAAFCFSRCHMRALAIRIAASCDERSLQQVAGSAGELLFDQSRSTSAFDAEPAGHQRPRVTLARVAA